MPAGSCPPDGAQKRGGLVPLTTRASGRAHSGPGGWGAATPAGPSGQDAWGVGADTQPLSPRPEQLAGGRASWAVRASVIPSGAWVSLTVPTPLVVGPARSEGRPGPPRRLSLFQNRKRLRATRRPRPRRRRATRRRPAQKARPWAGCGGAAPRCWGWRGPTAPPAAERAPPTCFPAPRLGRLRGQGSGTLSSVWVGRSPEPAAPPGLGPARGDARRRDLSSEPDLTDLSPPI